MQDLNGKVVIVTGGAASIGLDIVTAFVAAGARVVAADIADGAAVRRLGQAARTLQVDVTRDDELRGLVDETIASFGQLDAVVTCAAVYVDQGAASSREDWLKTLNVNLVSSAILGEIARPHLARRRGAIVNLSSVSAYGASAGRWTYPVSKAAILHLTRQQALDYAADGIRANTVSPGWTWSDPIRDLSGGDLAKADAVAAEFHILGRLARGAEVANAVLFLCSDLASFTTGAELRVDGGYLALGPEQATPAIAKLTGGRATVA